MVSWCFLQSPGAKMQLLRPKATFQHFSDFCVPKSLFSEKVTFERKSDFWAPGTRKRTNFLLVFKRLGAIGANGDFRRRENGFRVRFYENRENGLRLSKKSIFENAQTRPVSRPTQNDCSWSSERRGHPATFRKNAKFEKFPLFWVLEQKLSRKWLFDFSGPKSDFSRPGSRVCL